MAKSRKAKAAKRSAKSQSQADRLIEIANTHFTFGCSTDKEPFVVARYAPSIAMMIGDNCRAFRKELAALYQTIEGTAPNSAPLKDALLVLQGHAAARDQEAVHLRTAMDDGTVLIDLGDNAGSAVRVGQDGWTLLENASLLFRRYKMTKAFPIPIAPGDIESMRHLFNLDDESWRLLVGWMVSAFIPDTPCPILLLGGEQGTGKTMAAEMIAGLVDPSSAPIQSPPSNQDNWVVAASGSWVCCIDNLSSIPMWWSDSLCKAISGDSLVRRKLYTDSEQSVISLRRRVILTSIDPGALRGDLGERVMMLDLQPIPDSQRRTEREIKKEFEKHQATAFAGLLDLAVHALRHRDQVSLPRTPRMADFTRVLAALDHATDSSSATSYVNQRRRIDEEVVEGDEVACILIDLIRDKAEYSGTAGDILEALKRSNSSKGGPATPRAVADCIKRVTPNLRRLGIEVSPPHPNARPRKYVIRDRRELMKFPSENDICRNESTCSDGCVGPDGHSETSKSSSPEVKDPLGGAREVA